MLHTAMVMFFNILSADDSKDAGLFIGLALKELKIPENFITVEDDAYADALIK